MRLFFASWPPAGTAGALHAWAGEARRGCGGRVTRQEAIHLTLAFLGEADPEEAKAVGGAVRLPGCLFVIEQARYWARNRIVWAGPAETPPGLSALATALGETRRFAAHVTLIRDARPPRGLPAAPAVEWPVREFALVSSRPAPEGASYEVLERYALR